MNVVVTGGGTIAPIDDVRSITNASTGRLSAEISEACLAQGCSVWHVHAPSAKLPFHRLASFPLDTTDPAAEFERLSSIRSKYQEAKSRLHLRPLLKGTVDDYAQTLQDVFLGTRIDIAFLAMAVSDYEPEFSSGKIPSDRDSLDLHLRPTPKVIRSVRDWAPSAYLVGFKLLVDATAEELIEQANSACATSRADLTVANDLKAIREGRHTLFLIRPGRIVETIGPGDLLAENLVGRALTWARERQVVRSKLEEKSSSSERST